MTVPFTTITLPAKAVETQMSDIVRAQIVVESNLSRLLINAQAGLSLW
jgi:hypothetical protein